MTISILTISGSLRSRSTNGVLLEAGHILAPPGVAISAYRGIAELPHFNPDLEVDPLPPQVTELRAAVRAADALLISCPEYARGIPGSFKNMLDWLVGDTNFYGKPIVLWTASARASAGPAALHLVLTTMSGHIVEDACLTLDLISAQRSAEDLAADSDIAASLRNALQSLVTAITSSQAG